MQEINPSIYDWTQKECYSCKKQFHIPSSDWVYKRTVGRNKNVYFCSWGCLRKYEKIQARKYPSRYNRIEVGLK